MKPWDIRIVPRAIGAVMAVVLITALPLHAQETGSVRGQVVNATSGEPLPGVQVSVEGTDIGMLTDAEGNFLLVNVPAGERTVRAQNLGYRAASETITVQAGDAAVVTFELSESAIALDQIVVTGTAGGSQRRAIGNSTSGLNVNDVTEVMPVADVQQLLGARVPGLTLLSSTGQAGGSSRIRIRGAGSLSAGLDPVVFVDGVRFQHGAQSGGSTRQHTDALSAINPNDIESIEVIKGPAASTLYGAEAAGGVIQIITKKGSDTGGDVQWSVGVERGQVEWAEDRPTTYTTCDAEKIGDDQWPGCDGASPGALLVDSPLDNTFDCTWTTECKPNPLRTGDQTVLNLSARGGSETFNFYLSGERTDEDGVYYNNFHKRTSGRANIGFVPNEQLSIDLNVSYARTHTKMPLSNNSSNSILRNAMRGRPGYAAPWAPGYLSFSPEISNQYDFQHFSERTMLGLTANFNPFEWLHNRLTIGLDNNERTEQEFFRIDETGRAPWGATTATGEIELVMPERHTWTLDYSGNIINDFGADYSSTFSAGMQLAARRDQELTASGDGLVADRLNLVGDAANRDGDQTKSEQTSLGFYLQEQLGYKNRLFGTVAVRVDDNSAFGEEFSLVAYPKAQLSYVISDEDFFRIRAVDELRLRGAWGRAGNSPAPFSADRTWEPGVTTWVDDGGNEIAVNAVSPDDFGNPDLKAETGTEIELGFDASLFRGNLSMDFTYYRQRTKDALIEVSDPPSSGFTGEHLINIGEIHNSGVELMLSGTPLRSNNLLWDVALSFATNSNELISWGGAREEATFGDFATVQKHTEGYPLGGLWSTDVERDSNGNPIVQDSVAVVSNEMEYVGPMLPTREIGLTNSVTLFNNLRLYAMVDYKGGNYQWCAICSINARVDGNSWEVNNPDATAEEKAVYTSLQTKTWIYPADFVKLRELSATYALPVRWANSLRAERASLTLSARNLWMWTRYGGPNDPEVAFDTSDDFEQTDYASSPMMRRLSMSLRFEF